MKGKIIFRSLAKLLKRQTYVSIKIIGIQRGFVSSANMLIGDYYNSNKNAFLHYSPSIQII